MPAEVVAWLPPAAGGIIFGAFDADGSGFGMEAGPTGCYLPPVVVSSTKVPGQDGETVTAIRYAPRPITLPIEVHGASASTTRALLRQLAEAFDPLQGASILRFVTPDGDVRDISALYAGGLEGDEATADPALTNYTFNVQVVAYDPWFQDPADSQQLFTAGTGGSFFPIFPIALGASSVFTDTLLTVAGDAPETYPVWLITGPGSELLVVNTTTGRKLKWGGSLDVGEQLTIDTRPGAQSPTPKSAIDNAGNNRFSELDENVHDLWPLVSGTQGIHIEYAGTDPASQVLLTWRNRYRTK